MVQPDRRPADAATAGAAPRHPSARRSRRLRAAVPDGADRAGGHDRALRRHPRWRARRVPLWRPSPLFRAHRLEALLDTPARIYYKYEGVSPAGSHKPNTAVPQAYYNHQEGITKLTTETGAGQWGTALAFATSQYGMECEIWQVAASYRQKPYRKTMMEIWGATLHSSPSELTEFGRSVAGRGSRSSGLARHRDLRGGGDVRRRPERPLRARFGAQPRADAPDDHRRRGTAAVGEGRRDT